MEISILSEITYNPIILKAFIVDQTIENYKNAAKDINNMFVNSFTEIMETINLNIDNIADEKEYTDLLQIVLFSKGMNQLLKGFLFGYKNTKMNENLKCTFTDAKNVLEIINGRIVELEEELINRKNTILENC